MAKVSLNKLNLPTKFNEKEILDWNGEKIEITKYLPISDKLDLISDICFNTYDEKGYLNPARRQLYFVILTIEKYTNINITEKQKEDPGKLYDMLVASGLKDKIFELIPSTELERIYDTVWELLDNIYKYQNSLYGILDTVGDKYSTMELDATKIQKLLTGEEGENLGLLKDILKTFESDVV